MSETLAIRLGIIIAGLVLIAVIFWSSRGKKPVQGQRSPTRTTRNEPTLGEDIRDALADETASSLEQHEPDAVSSQSHEPGRRQAEEFDKIVTLYVAARAGQTLHGPDILVAAEKVGLVYGHMQIFHRLLEGKPSADPVFSVANIMKPGNFDLARLDEVQTPAIAFFLTLPAPVDALEAWDTMHPTAQRMAELLDGVLLDGDRNALGRQRITHIRDEMRAYDRARETPDLFSR